MIARTSSFAFRGKEQDITKIAEALRVRTILEGSVRRSGNRIRVSAQLIEAQNGSHLWSERYDRDMTDVFAVQDDIGQAISEALKVRLAPRTQAVNIEAWQNCLKGRYHLSRATPESLAEARECFEQALVIEPNLALAFAGLASYYYTLAIPGIKPAVEVMPLSKAAAEKALAIDPANSAAHSVRAMIAGVFDYDWKAAETHHRQAMAVEPVPPTVRANYASYLLPLGRAGEAIEQARLALESDPLSMLFHLLMVSSRTFARQYREAIECVRRAMEIDANFYPLWSFLGVAQMAAGFAQEAITSFQRLVELAPWLSDGVWALAAAYHMAGDRDRSREWAGKAAGSGGTVFFVAYYYAATGEADAMFEALERAYQQRDLHLTVIPSHPLFDVFDPYRAEPRFQSLLRRMNLA